MFDKRLLTALNKLAMLCCMLLIETINPRPMRPTINPYSTRSWPDSSSTSLIIDCFIFPHALFLSLSECLSAIKGAALGSLA